jgi:hypothetical protein
MSSVIASPDLIGAAATDLAAIGSTVSAAHMTAAARTVAVIPAAADEVSAGIAHVFSVHAQDFQGLAAQAAAFHEQFVQHLNASAGSYASAEAANAAMLQASNANAGSFVGALVGTFVDQLVNFVGAVLSQLVNLLAGLLNLLFGLITLPLAIVGQVVGFVEQLIFFPISVLLLLF